MHAFHSLQSAIPFAHVCVRVCVNVSVPVPVRQCVRVQHTATHCMAIFMHNHNLRQSQPYSVKDRMQRIYIR